MPSFEQTVYSSMASAIAWDEESQSMVVTWKNGRQSVYEGVPEDVAVSIANAPSVGNALNTEIKPFYRHRYAR